MGNNKLGKGVKFQRIRRITGYLVGTLDKWNDAKKAEERDRVKHGAKKDGVEVAHGHWYGKYGITICSHCQAMFDTDLTMLQVPSTWEMPRYCPNCGAKMDGDGDA